MFWFKKHIARIAVNMKPIKGPWGGSSVFVSQMTEYLKDRNYRVQFNLRGNVDVIILIDPRDDLQSKAFGMQEIIAYQKSNPQVILLHRINECDKRKSSSFMDDFLKKANIYADHTVFISEWLRDYHAELWFDKNNKPSTVVYNGADPGIFYPRGKVYEEGKEPFRIATHHWSDNPMKGFDVYKQVDELIGQGELPDVELWVIGRWPKEIKWKKARTFPATSGKDLADLLRQCHAYITASLWEPCGMHHIEGAQCGLPLIYHEDGGGIVEAGRKYGVGFTTNVKFAINETMARYNELKRKLTDNMPSGEKMCEGYFDVIRKMIGK